MSERMTSLAELAASSPAEAVLDREQGSRFVRALEGSQRAEEGRYLYEKRILASIDKPVESLPLIAGYAKG